MGKGTISGINDLNEELVNEGVLTPEEPSAMIEGGNDEMESPHYFHEEKKRQPKEF